MSGRATYDVAVVGGGVAGAAIAWRFAQRGLKVGLFEDLREGAASPAAGGILCAQVEAEDAGPLFDLLRAAEEVHVRLADELGADRIGYRQCGVLRVALDAQELATLALERREQQARGLEVEALDAAAVRALEPALSSRVLGANHFPRGGQVDSRALRAELLAQGERAGVVRHTASVAGVRVVGGRVVGLEVPGVEVSAPRVVVAAGAWSSRLSGTGLTPDAIQPVRGQMVELSAPSPRLSRVVFGAGGYLVPRGDRVLVGSTMERVGFQPAAGGFDHALLRVRAVVLWPALDRSVQSGAWFGFRPATLDGLPAIGPTAIEGLHLAVGFLRNGILLAPLAADLVVEAALGTSAIPRPFAAARLLC